MPGPIPASGDTWLARALERAGDGAFVVGADGRLRLWNRAAEKILGYPAREVIGRACCEVLRGYDEHANRVCYPGCQVTTLLGLGESVQAFDMRTTTKAGRPVWLNISVLTAPGPGSGAVSVHLFRDVTATRELVRLVHERLTAAAEPQDPAAETLTRREVEILQLLARGVRTADIAERLHVSRATVKNHVQHILAKLGLHSRLEAVAYANRHRLL
ncbi:MAG TPA: LuxR C-terminal-related transcriptional regulator [Methylomirabilota bacterium]|nr:LuxR C-terminal-related transcriptional regulator [Methylomirabilota bacterium]